MDLNIKKPETLGNSSCLLLRTKFRKFQFSHFSFVRQEQRNAIVWLTFEAVKANKTRTAINNANRWMEYEFLLITAKLVNGTNFSLVAFLQEFFPRAVHQGKRILPFTYRNRNYLKIL